MKKFAYYALLLAGVMSVNPTNTYASTKERTEQMRRVAEAPLDLSSDESVSSFLRTYCDMTEKEISKCSTESRKSIAQGIKDASAQLYRIYSYNEKRKETTYKLRQPSMYFTRDIPQETQREIKELFCSFIKEDPDPIIPLKFSEALKKYGCKAGDMKTKKTPAQDIFGIKDGKMVVSEHYPAYIHHTIYIYGPNS